MPGGRPTEYSDKILKKAKAYLQNLPGDEVVHTIEGLAIYINISRSNIYLWASQEDKIEFSDIVEGIREKQAQKLISRGLTGDFNSSITKVLLTKHGYREGIETTGAEGTPLHPTDTERVKALTEQMNELYRSRGVSSNGEPTGVVDTQAQDKK